MNNIKLFTILLTIYIIFGQITFPVFALSPYFYIVGDNTIGGDNHDWFVKLDTADQTVGTFQTVLNYDSNYLTGIQTNTQNSVCTIWSAMDSVPPGESLSRVTPYFYNSKLLISCGVTGAGIKSSDALVLSFTMRPILVGYVDFSFTDSRLYLNGNSITPGASDVHTVNIISLEATVSATPTPTSQAASASARITTRTLFSDVTFQQWNPNTRSSGSTSTTTGSNTSQLEELVLDNTVPPPPPDMTPRAKKQPRTLADMANVDPATESGEVKAIQSLRDLLIPGKSQADKTVVLINFLTTIIFLIILAFVLWRMMNNTRTSKLKNQYMSELISGELSALESKMEIVGEKAGKDRFEEEFDKSVRHILEEVNPKKEKEEKVKIPK